MLPYDLSFVEECEHELEAKLVVFKDRYEKHIAKLKRIYGVEDA